MVLFGGTFVVGILLGGGDPKFRPIPTRKNYLNKSAVRGNE